jgi:hypothetical protein
MPVLSDFIVLNKPGAGGLAGQDGTFEHPYVIGDNLDKRFTHTFNTGGRHHATALLSLMVRGLSRGSARVAISSSQNGEVNIGRIQASSPANREFWRHEQFIIERGILSPDDSEANTLIIGRVEDNQAGGGTFEEFEVRDIVCFFHQST